MDLRRLRYFVAVAEELHFGRAAERLHMAQPPLSQQIRRLEAELGVDLLRRSSRRVELTPAGAAYLERARELLASAEAAAQEARRVAAGLSGRLVVGYVGSATYSLLPALARALGRQLPDVETEFRGELLVPDLAEGLAAGEIDLGLLRPPVRHPGIEVGTLRRDPFVVVLPEEHRLARRPELTMADLRFEQLVSYHSRSVMYGVLTGLAEQAGFVPRIRHEVSETSALLTFVAAGLGLAVAPSPVAALSVEGATYRPLVGADGAEDPGIDLVVGTRVGDGSPHLHRAVGVLRRLVSA